jgi:imidazolonepropionase-like amidohydrolase
MMVQIFLSFYILIILYFPATAQTYIVNTNILDVEHKKLLTAQTVVVKGDKIINVDKTNKIKPPAGASIIDGGGKFLIPGLVDAHVHFFQSGGLYTRPDVIDLRKYYSYQKEIEWTHRNMEDLLQRYIKAGITTVIDVGSTINFLIQRDTFKNKSSLPLIYMTGPLLTTWEPDQYLNLGSDEPFYLMTDEKDAREYVRKQLPFKPDFIKIWYIVTDRNIEEGARKTLHLVKAAIDEAHNHNLKVAVHATERITAQLAVESGCDFLVHGIDDEIVDNQFLQLLKRKNVILCPTLSVGYNYNEVLGQEYELSYTDYIHSNPYPTGSLFDLKHIQDTVLVNNYKNLVRRQASLNRTSDSILKINLQKMVDAGITIVTGTDAGNIGTLHATSYYEELQNMKRAGMTAWQILQASTINGAKIFSKEQDYGSISTGKHANMVLLSANPLDSIQNWQKIELVFNQGAVINPATIVEETPLMLVQRQLNGYNGHNLEAFLEPFSEDVQVFNLPEGDTLIGKQHLRTVYKSLLDKLPGLHCEIENRMIKGNIIIDYQKIRGLQENPTELIAIYLIEENKIKKVYLFQ